MDWLIRFEASALDHLGPLFGFFSDEHGRPRPHRRIGERCVDLPIEPFHDPCRSALWHADAEPAANRVARDDMPIGGRSGSTLSRAVAVTDWICGIADGTASDIACTSPARSAECAASVPR